MNPRNYGGIIWTNHALQRLDERRFPQKLAWEAFRYPDESEENTQKGNWEFRKKFGISTVTVIATQNERREWLIVSCWIDPPLPGTKDAKKKEDWIKYKKASFWGKLWYTVKKQLGF